jgi:hypothetical protein
MKKLGAFLALSLLAGSLQCSLFGSNDDGTDGAVLQVAHRTLSIEVGETAVIPVVALTPDGSPDTFGADCPGGCVQATVGGASVSVEGLALGERTLCIASGSGCSANVTVRVHDPKALMTSGLAITYAD